MSCDAFESMIALDAGGDLPAADAERLARHLAACVDCRRFATEMRQSQRAVALLADVPVDEEVLAAVRAGVLGKVGGRSTVVPFRLPPRVLALAAVLTVALGALFLLRFGRPVPDRPVPIERLEAPAPRIAEVPAVQQPAPGPEPTTAEPESAGPPAPDRAAADFRAPIEETALKTPEPGPPVTVSPTIRAAMPTAAVATAMPAAEPPKFEPMVIKLVSEEADLVIYWLVPTPTEATKETTHEISAV